MIRKKTKNTLGKAKQKAWVAFSKYIRISMSDEDGYALCVTCGVKKHYTELHAGHFIGGRHNSVLFDERNCHTQCAGCNIFGRGKFAEYLTWMKKKYGNEVIDELLELDRQTVKYSRTDYEELEKHFKDKLNNL